MACRSQGQEVAADAYIYYDSAQTAVVQEHYWRRPEPSAPPARGEDQTWQGASVASMMEAGQAAAHAFRMADQTGNVQVMFVQNLQVNVAAAGGAGQGVIISEAIDQQSTQALVPFQANDPVFHPCYSPQGVDFGKKVVSRGYKAEKHVHSQFNVKMVTYDQCSSTAQAISHALTLYLSHKRSKHAIFLFDRSLAVEELTSNWPSDIYLSEIKCLIRQLGPQYEYHRRKVKKGGFSLYLFVIKRIGVRFSERGQRTWSNFFQWADSLKDSVENAGSDSSTQVIAKLAGIGLGILAAI